MQNEESVNIETEKLRRIKHDVKNQLSNMILCIEQLKYEIADPKPDWKYYMDAVSKGCATINKIINDI